VVTDEWTLYVMGRPLETIPDSSSEARTYYQPLSLSETVGRRVGLPLGQFLQSFIQEVQSQLAGKSWSAELTVDVSLGSKDLLVGIVGKLTLRIDSTQAGGGS